MQISFGMYEDKNRRLKKTMLEGNKGARPTYYTLQRIMSR